MSDASADQKTVGTDGEGRFRFTAFDNLKPLPTDAALADVIAAYNAMLKGGRGQ